MTRELRPFAAIGVSILVACLSAPAAAKPTGYNLVCSNCHDGGLQPTVTVTAMPTTVAPGGVTTLTVTVARTNGNRAGFFVTTRGKGEFQLVDAVGTRLIAATDEGPAGVTHTQPKTSTTGNNVFQVRWKAPAQMGSVDFDVYAVSATGKIDPVTNMVFPEDDGMGHQRLGFSFGCAGSAFWPDNDGDGFGTKDPDGPTQLCQPMKGFAATSDDCNDGEAAINPKATEICNQVDDDCDGKVDEDLPPVPLYKDTDNDGYGVPPAVMMGACGAVNGFSARIGDCNDNDRMIHPGAKETCNALDDDCDGRPDNGVLPTCGVGWCARTSSNCSASACIPGKPRAEECNGFDDDCNGVVDDGAGLCPAGQACVNGACAGAGADAGSAPDGGPGVTGGATAGGCAIGDRPSAGGPAVLVVAAIVPLMTRGWRRRRRRSA